MKKILFCLIIIASFSGCGLFTSLFQKEETFIVVDRDSNAVLNKYQYDYSKENPLIRTESYDSSQRLSRIREYTYDEKGYVRTITEEYAGGTSRVIEFITTEERDSQGRLTKVIQHSSAGDKVETFYGYDEQGKLRGTVLRSNNDSVIMKDYDEIEEEE